LRFIKKIISLFLYSSIFAYSVTGHAYSNKQLGDVGRFAIPLTSLAASLLVHDFQGIGQLVLSNLVVQGTSEGLKLITHERRPNGGCCHSFPSGHAAGAFTAASYIQFRYKFLYSVPLYAAATYVAYSRVQVKAHYTHDVAFGAALGIAGTYLSTTPYQRYGQVSVQVDRGFAGIIYRKIFD
jgi:membrane-associated phospholipid phosphatase